MASWGTPGRTVVVKYEHVEGAPSWWIGDEEASQSFLQAYAPGVILDG